MAGRPSKFDDARCEQAEKLCRLGATDKEIADFFDVAVSTITLWKQQHPEFSAALKRGKLQADAEVASKLYRRATGYEHEEVHVSNYQGAITLTPLTKHYAPDTTACIFWLKNRRPDLWRDRVEHAGPNGGPIPVENISDLELARRIAFALDTATLTIGKAAESSKATVEKA